MKKRILLLAILFPSICLAGGATVPLTWEPLPDPTWGVKIHIGTESGNYNNTENAGINETMYQLDNLQYNTTYYIAASCYDENGNESVVSPEVVWTSPGIPQVTFEPMPVIPDTVKQYILTIQPVP